MCMLLCISVVHAVVHAVVLLLPLRNAGSLPVCPLFCLSLDPFALGNHPIMIIFTIVSFHLLRALIGPRSLLMRALLARSIIDTGCFGSARTILLTCISPAHLPLTFSLLLRAYVLPHCMLFVARRCQARRSDQPLWRSSVATLVPLTLLRLGSQHSAALALRQLLRLTVSGALHTCNAVIHPCML